VKTKTSTYWAVASCHKKNSTEASSEERHSLDGAEIIKNEEKASSLKKLSKKWDREFADRTMKKEERDWETK